MKLFTRLVLTSTIALSSSSIVFADEYDDLRNSSANMTPEQASKVEAGRIGGIRPSMLNNGIRQNIQSPRYSESWGNYRPAQQLPRDAYGNPQPSAATPHTQIGTGRGGNYTTAREWNYQQNTGAGQIAPTRQIDFTNHSRLNHTNPHQHMYTPNPTGGTYQRGSAIPFP